MDDVLPSKAVEGIRHIQEEETHILFLSDCLSLETLEDMGLSISPSWRQEEFRNTSMASLPPMSSKKNQARSWKVLVRLLRKRRLLGVFIGIISTSSQRLLQRKRVPRKTTKR